MEFQKVRALRGPNLWANFPVLEAWVDLGPLKDSPSDELPGFNDRLTAWLPSLVEHRCSVGTRGGFFERLRRGTYQAHILEHVALELQTLAGTPVGFGRTRETSTEGVYKVALEYEEEDLAREALEVARRLCLAAVHDQPFDVSAEVEHLRELARRLCPPPGTAAVLQAARARRVPVWRVNGEGLLVLGQGVNQRRYLAGQTDTTGALAETIAGDNHLLRPLLAAAGVPTPEGRPAESAEDAWSAAQEVGTPVTVRRRYGAAPETTVRNLSTRDEVLAAHDAVSSGGYSALVEKSAPGELWRLLVVGERVVAAARRQPHADATDRLHPEVADRAVEAARVVGLDVAGVDVLATDLGLPLEEQGGVVTAVDARPDLGLHWRPGPPLGGAGGMDADGRGAPCGHLVGGARPVGEAVLDHLFPEGQTGRIPVVAVTGVNGKTTTTRLIAHVIARAGRVVGMTCTEGIYVDGRRIEPGDCSGPKSARNVLRNPRIEAAVCEVARGGILREGLGFDSCDVAVVTNIGEGDHLGICGIDTLEDLARVKRTIVEVVGRQGAAVLKADDPHTAGMAGHCNGSTVFFCRDGSHPVLVKHRAANGRAAFVRAGHIVLAEGGQEIPLVPLAAVPLTHGGLVAFQVENALAAAAAAWSLGIPCEAIRVGLETFSSRVDRTPARFNLLSVNGATVVLDYGHNTSSLACLIETLGRLPHARRVAVYSAAGDRRDADIIRQGQLLGDAFDRVILYEEEACSRGRPDGEIPGLFRKGLAGRRRVKKVDQVQGAVHAVEVALEQARPGELLLVQVDRVDETMDLVKRQLAANGSCREIDFREAFAAGRPEKVAAV
jgi:cyanophycin synthetase